MGKVMPLGTNKYPTLLLCKLRSHYLETTGKQTGLVTQLNDEVTKGY